MPVDPTSMLAAAVNKHPGVLAIAIEDRVDLWFSTSENHLVKFGEEIPPTGGTFLDAVHELLRTLIQKLVEKLQTTHSQPAEQLFRCIGSTVVSIPGAVHQGTTLVQIGLLGSKDIQWGLGKKKKTVFDFPKELSTIIREVIGDAWDLEAQKVFEDSVRVLNDTTSAVIGEVRLRLEANRPNAQDRRRLLSFVYLKMHNGINAAAVGPDVTVNLGHSEAGHSFPILHSLDVKAGFPGICEYHSNCFQGMMASQSFVGRAVSANLPLFKSWNRELARQQRNGVLEAKGRRSGPLDDAIMRFVLAQEDGVELLAWYAAQLTYQLAIGPLVPDQVVIGGKLATPRVLDAVRINVKKWSNGFPKRDVYLGENKKAEAFSKPGLALFIVQPHSSPAEEPIEIHGAYAYAEKLAKRDSPIWPLRAVR